ncbi:MAG: dephospho-CoA kinase [Clostridiales bacterium]|nr:dephospho-CoA kinase [Clostridiales bacterium]
MLEKQNSHIIDCDKISRETTRQDSAAYFEIIAHFGERIIKTDGEIDRKALGNIVFNNKAALKKLEEITHKAIKAEVFTRLKEAKKGHCDLVVIDAPLLVESGLNEVCDRVWLIYADYELRLKRIAKRDSLTLEAAKSRLRSQTAFDELKAYADEIIDTTNLSLDEMEEKITNLKENLYG